MVYGSICSGIEAASVAWHPLGWKCAFMSEIDPFPRAVLKHRYPDVPLHGDFTTIQNGDYEPIRLLVGGTPCQSFSVAGLRGGLTDDRGNLALEFCRLAQRLRPTWLVWENVPGVLSSNGGRDFGAILGALAELGYGLAYRVLDAQYFGVPQRRRRVFVVGYLGDWRPAAAVFFERHSLSGNNPPSRKTRQEITDAIRDGVAGSIGAHGTGGWPGSTLDQHGAYIPETSHASIGTLSGQLGKGGPTGQEVEHLIAFGTKEFAQDAGAISPPLRAMGSSKDHPNGGGQVAVAFPSGLSGTQRLSAEDRCPALSVGHNMAIAIQAGNTQQNGSGIGDDIAYTLDGSGPQSVASFSADQTEGAGSIAYREEQSSTLRGGSSGTNQVPALHKASQVRRLTPLECERLQGFPDNWTKIPWRRGEGPDSFESMLDRLGKRLREPARFVCPDGPRYKVTGNSMAVPCMRWIGERIQMVEEMLCTSLISEYAERRAA